MVDPKDFLVWMITQKNRRGTCYLERVARHYIRHLQTHPLKLNMPVPINERDVFKCDTVESFDRLNTAFIAAPNYRKVNSNGHQSFSSGLAVYRRYLESIRMQGASIENVNIENVVSLLSEHFPYGYRLDSPIEFMRFRQLLIEKFGSSKLPDDNELKRVIAACGTICEGKVYIVNKKTEEHIKSEIDLAFPNGEGLIFYDVFYDYHREWLFAESVVSENMLRGIIERMYPSYSFKTNYFSPKVIGGDETSNISAEILRTWGNEALRSYDQMAIRLPYIPFDKIKTVLAVNSDFIWNTIGVYTHISKIVMADDECAAISSYVSESCRECGYALLNDIPLEDFVAQNCELSLTAIQNAVYKICLADNYDRNGKIVVLHGNVLDVLTLLKEYCRTLDSCSLQDLRDYQYRLIGDNLPTAPIEAGYAEMVRTEEDTFLAERYIHFDVEAIDAVLDLFVLGYYVPLKSIMTFAPFPHCGRTWNLFLLESYVRRFSRRYRFVALSTNSSNVGVIARTTCDWSINDIMSDALANSDTQLTTEDSLNFLCNQGYIAKRKYSKIKEIVGQAKTIRGRRD
jgi:hypothetical protein